MFSKCLNENLENHKNTKNEMLYLIALTQIEAAYVTIYDSCDKIASIRKTMKHINRLGKDKLVSVVDIQTILE
jgi:hypothetical protein